MYATGEAGAAVVEIGSQESVFEIFTQSEVVVAQYATTEAGTAVVEIGPAESVAALFMQLEVVADPYAAEEVGEVALESALGSEESVGFANQEDA